MKAAAEGKSNLESEPTIRRQTAIGVIVQAAKMHYLREMSLF